MSPEPAGASGTGAEAESVAQQDVCALPSAALLTEHRTVGRGKSHSDPTMSRTVGKGKDGLVSPPWTGI